MHIGFTGTRKGMTEPQKQTTKFILHAIKRAHGTKAQPIFHHGDCIGADAEAHDLAEMWGYYIIGHPGDSKKSSANKHCDIKLPNRPMLARNEDIVVASDLLLAAPRSLTEEVRSGTWATVRYARKHGVPVVILDP